MHNVFHLYSYLEYLYFLFICLLSGSRRPYSTTPPGTPLSTSLTGQVNTTQSGNYSSTLPALPSTAPYTIPQITKSESVFDELDYIDLPHRGRCKVYIARYSYDPIKQSPNENPEAELQLIAGDYVLIFGDMDEVSFLFVKCIIKIIYTYKLF